MKGDRVEVVVDTGHGTQTFEIVASRAGRRLEVTTARGVVDVTEVTRGGTPVRTGRFMATRVVALVEHPALEDGGARVDVETRRRLTAGEGRQRRAARDAGRSAGHDGRRPAGEGRAGHDTSADTAAQLALLAEEEAAAREPDPMDELHRIESEA